MESCIFCRITAGEIPSHKVYEDERYLAFRDIAPQARVHVLVIPKAHIPDWTAAAAEEDATLAGLMRAAAAAADAEGIAASGYRIVSNSGRDACQSVPHLHMHVLGGEKLAERMA